MECPASLLPDHDGDDHDVPHQPAHHAEDVHTQVQSQLWHCGPWICHGLRGVISNWNNAQLKTGQHSVFKHFSSQVLQILNGQKLIRTLSHSASLFTITRFLKTLKVFVSNAIILGLPYQLALGNLLLPNMQNRKKPLYLPSPVWWQLSVERLWQREHEGRKGEKSSNQGSGELKFVMIK